MNFSKLVWNQLKNKTTEEIISALKRDGAVLDTTRGSAQVFRYPDGRRAAIHYHPHKTYGPELLKDLIADIGWTEADLRRLRLVK